MVKWYAVAQGRIPGFYSNWPACQAQTNGFSNPKYKSFSTKKEAAEFLLQMEVIVETPYTEQLKNEINIAIYGAVALAQANSPEDFESSEGVDIFVLPKIPSHIKVGSIEFFDLDRDCLDPGNRTVAIYVDGSKMPTIDHRGSGVYCRFKGQDYGMSAPFTKEIADRYQLTDDEMKEMSSPSMEYLAFAETLWQFIYIRLPEVNGVVQKLKHSWTLIFVCDYNGVQNFTHGYWTPKETHIVKIYNVCDTIIKFLKIRDIHVVVKHCPGHNDIHGNELSDIYAKGTSYQNNLPVLVREISKKFLQDD